MTAVALYPRLGKSDETISREDVTSDLTSVNLSQLWKEIREIKERNPDLYLALAKDDSNLIR